MELREILTRGHIPVLDPYMLNETSDEFFAKYGSFLEKIALVAKRDTGYTLYRSMSAPTDDKYSEFFSSFTQIASDIAIDVYAVVSTFVDQYFAHDPKYGAYRSGITRTPSGVFVCPVQESYWRYLTAVVKEILNFPISGIILMDNQFARQEFCFCETCRKEFSELTGLEREFVFDTLVNDPDVLSQWYDWRIKKITTALSSIVENVRETPDIEVLINVDLDPETDYLEGSKKNFGQDVMKISDIANQLLINVLPLTPSLPQPGSPDYERVLSELAFTRDLNRIGRKYSIFNWGVTDPEVETLEKMKADINATYLFLLEGYPETYKERREIHLGLF
ncbi:MAG: hypothetical protein ACFFCD_06695 [Promethearchaeota archaeon]